MATKKILIVGVSASGKSTFARKLGEKLGLPVFHVDEIMWQPGWQYIGDEATAKALKEIMLKDEWIVEGYIEDSVRESILQAVDKIIYLDYPGWLSAWRYVKRWWLHRVTPRPELPGSPETFSWEFMWRVFKKKEVWKLEQLLRAGTYEDKLFRLSSLVETKTYTEAL